VLEVQSMSPTDERLAYVRLFQKIRSGAGVGRQIVATVRDGGQKGSPLMGVASVGLPQYFQGERDVYLGWPNPQVVPLAARIREAALPHIGQLSLFVAIPPYDRLGLTHNLGGVPYLGVAAVSVLGLH
jgi:hypothetical protein